MGKNKQATPIEEKKSFGIPPGLVARRREELIAAREQYCRTINPINGKRRVRQ